MLLRMHDPKKNQCTRLRGDLKETCIRSCQVLIERTLVCQVGSFQAAKPNRSKWKWQSSNDSGDGASRRSNTGKRPQLPEYQVLSSNRSLDPASFEARCPR